MTDVKHLILAAMIVLTGASGARGATMRIMQTSSEADANQCQPASIICKAQTATQIQVLNIGDVVDALTGFGDHGFATAGLTDRSSLPFLVGGDTRVAGQPVVTEEMSALLGLGPADATEVGPTFSGFIPAGGVISITRNAVAYSLPDVPDAPERGSAEVVTDAPRQASNASSAEPAILVLLGVSLAGMGVAARYRPRANRTAVTARRR